MRFSGCGRTIALRTPSKCTDVSTFDSQVYNTQWPAGIHRHSARLVDPVLTLLSTSLPATCLQVNAVHCSMSCSIYMLSKLPLMASELRFAALQFQHEVMHHTGSVHSEYCSWPASHPRSSAAPRIPVTSAHSSFGTYLPHVHRHATAVPSR